MQPGDNTPDNNQPTSSPAPEKTGETTELSDVAQETPEISEAPGTDPTSSPAETVNDPNQPIAAWEYNAEDPIPQDAPQPVSWSASEFIDHEKRIGWFVAVAAIAMVAAVVVYLLTHDIVNAGVIIIVAVLFAVFAAREPRTLTYGVDAHGIHIANRTYRYADFKSFAVIQEGGISCIQLAPLKRFAIPISLYFPADQEETILAMLGNYLPNEIRKVDPIDQLMRKVRF